MILYYHILSFGCNSTTYACNFKDAIHVFRNKRTWIHGSIVCISIRGMCRIHWDAKPLNWNPRNPEVNRFEDFCQYQRPEKAEFPDHLVGYSPVDTSKFNTCQSCACIIWGGKCRGCRQRVRFQQKLIGNKECTISVLLASPWVFVLSMSFIKKKMATVSDPLLVMPPKTPNFCRSPGNFDHVLPMSWLQFTTLLRATL